VAALVLSEKPIANADRKIECPALWLIGASREMWRCDFKRLMNLKAKQESDQQIKLDI